MKNKFFWFSKNSKVDKAIMIEYILKYGDMDDILELFKEIQQR